MTFNLSATNEDFKIVTKGGGTVVVPSSSTSAYLALSGNYLTAETEPAFAAMSAFLSSSISSKVMIQDGVNGTKTYKDLSIIVVNNSNLSDYANALRNGALNEDAFYVLNISALNAFGQKIENVDYPTISSDAATKKYVDDLNNANLASSDISAEYKNQHIYLSAKGQIVGNIDCSDFIKDGMLSAVELCAGQMIFKFNTDAGATPISVALSNFIDKNDYYTKSETSSASEISGAIANAGKGYTVIVRKLDDEGIGNGWCFVGGNQIEAQTNNLPAGLRIQHVDTSITETSVYNQSFIVVPNGVNSGGYNTVYVDGVAKNNEVIQLTGDTLVELYYLFCFLEGTLVKLADGTTKKIEDITYDDVLSVWNFDEGHADSAKPLWINEPHATTYCWETELQSGKKIRTAGVHGHRFFSLDENKFLYADEIAGHKIWTEDGEDVVTSSKLVQGINARFYNIITDRHINIFADGILAGCSLENGLHEVKDMKFVKDGRQLRDFSEFEGDVSREWFDGCRYAESSLSRKYLVNYFQQRNPSFKSLRRAMKAEPIEPLAESYDISSYVNVHKYALRNVSYGTTSSDVVVYKQLQDEMSSSLSSYKTYAGTKASLSVDGYIMSSNVTSYVSVPIDLSSFTNSPGYTKNTGTITGITMNGASKGTSGVVNLGTVLTAHQSLANYYQKSETSSSSQISNALSSKLSLSAAITPWEMGPYLSGSVVSYNGKIWESQIVDDQTPGSGNQWIETTIDQLFSSCAKSSDIKNATITVKQGNVTKGSFTLNQSSDYTLSLDEGGAGGSNVSVEAVLTSGTQIAKISVDNAVTNLYAPAGGGVIFDNRISGITGENQLSVIKLSAADYAQMLSDDTVMSNALYVIDEEYANAYGSAIHNVGAPSASTDAATKGYVDTNFQPVGSYLTAVPVDYKTYSNTVAALTGSSGFKTYSNTVTALTGTSGFKTYAQTKAALSNDGYATQAQVNQKSTVSFNQITTTGTNIGSITINGTTTQIYAPAGGGGGSSVQVSADYSTGTRVATISVDSVPTSIYVPNSSGGSSRYALETAQLVSSGGSLTCAVNDQAITTIQVSSSTTPVVVQLPAEPEDGARDFILRIEISSSTAPTFTFNGVNETIDFDSEDADWAVMEPGLNLVSFTETKRGTE